MPYSNLILPHNNGVCIIYASPLITGCHIVSPGSSVVTAYNISVLVISSLGDKFSGDLEQETGYLQVLFRIS